MMDTLPYEILSHIFSFLPYSDLKETRLVCNRWYEASQHTKLLDRETAVSISEYSRSFQDTLIESSRDFLHLSIKEELVRCYDNDSHENETIWYSNDFWLKFGPKLRSLELHNCKVRREQFLRVLSLCPSLRHLDIVACSNLFMCNDSVPPKEAFQKNSLDLSNLQSLNIVALYNPGAELFDVLVSSAPNLQILSLDECLGPIRMSHPQSLTCEYIQAFFSKNSHRTFVLDLSCLEGDDFEALIELVSMPNVRLRELQIHYNYSVTEFYRDRVSEFITSKKDLEKLSLICEVGDLVLGTICQDLQDLKDLKLFSCSEVIWGPGYLFTLKKLTTLKMAECYKVKSTSVLCGLCRVMNTTLQSLTLTYGKLLSQEVVMELARTHPSLTYLDLSRCDCVTNCSIQAVFRHLTALETLILVSCKNLDDSGLLGVGSALAPHLYTTSYSLRDLKNLRYLNVTNCPIDGSAFESGLQIADLRDLVVTSTEISANAFKCLVENNRIIEYLNVAFCLNVDDEILLTIGMKLRRLKRISLEGCVSVTSEGIQLLKQRLKGLKVQML